MRRNKKIPDGKYRIIKIGKDALLELIHEALKENEERLFEISDCTTIATLFDIDLQKGEVVFVARNELGDEERLQFPTIDSDALLEKMLPTTDSLYSGERAYLELGEEELSRIQGR